MLTISRLARQFRLSRSTLLYYDNIGLLKPSARTAANYRIYTKADSMRLEKICLYRQAGLPLSTIRTLLEHGKNSVVPVLKRRLNQLNQDIRKLRQQQQLIVDLLGGKSNRLPLMSREKWMELFLQLGLSVEQTRQLHEVFESLYPEEHQDFLESLLLSEEEVQSIRSRRRRG